jgi:ribosomal protein L7/L12
MARPAATAAELSESDTRHARLERQVRLLAAGLEIAVQDPERVVQDEVVELAREGKHVEAVRELRRSTGLGLIAAKRVVDAAAES